MRPWGETAIALEKCRGKDKFQPMSSLFAPDPSHVFNLLAWLVDAGLDGRSERGLTNGLAARLNAAGVPVHRISMGSDVLDPVLQSRSFIWRSESGTEKYRFERGLRRSDQWLKSPLFWMLSNERFSLHLPLSSTEAEQFPLALELREAGYTDYLARIVPYGDRARLGAGRGLMATFATRAEGGFQPGHIAFLDAVLPTFALAFMSQMRGRMMGRVLETYLGDTPARRVLKGDITRGEAQTIEAVIWMSDLSGFTKTTDPMPREAILEYLNAHAEVVADAIHAHGGEILKFIGDGVLAVFDGRNGAECAAESALDAALQVQANIARLREERTPQGLATSSVIIGLHHGTVLFGNFGSQDRLDFTALGSAVNEASRLVTLGKTLEQRLVASAAFHAALKKRQPAMVSLGRYALRGVSGAQHLYTVDNEAITKPETAPPPT